MKKDNNTEELLRDIEELKKDVYFSYVLKLNHRYVFKDLYSTFERINYINTNVNQYINEIENLYKEIDSKNIDFSNEDVLELKQVRRTKEISLGELDTFIKRSKNFISRKKRNEDVQLNYFKIVIPVILIVIYVVGEMI